VVIVVKDLELEPATTLPPVKIKQLALDTKILSHKPSHADDTNVLDLLNGPLLLNVLKHAENVMVTLSKSEAVNLAMKVLPVVVANMVLMDLPVKMAKD